MAAAGALVNAQLTLARLLSNQRIRAGHASRGSRKLALTGRHVAVPFGTQRLQRRSSVRQLQIRAEVVEKQEEQGEASSQKMIIVRVHDEHFKFTPDAPAHAIGAALECLAGQAGILVRAGDHYTPLADEEVPAGEYTFKTRSSFKEERAVIKERIRAMNERVTKLERRRNFFRF